MSRKFSQKSQKTKIIKVKLKEMVTLVVDFHSSTTYLQSQKFLALVTTSKCFFSKCPKNIVEPLYMKKTKTIWRKSFSLQAYIIRGIPPAIKNLAYVQIRMD